METSGWLFSRGDGAAEATSIVHAAPPLLRSDHGAFLRRKSGRAAVYYFGMLPEYLRPFFWDIKLEDFDPQAHPEYTIGRILEYGDERAVAWMRDNFSRAEIADVIRSERRLSPKSANFWALVYDIPATEVAALH